MEFYCSKCGKRESVTMRKAHCDCGGLWKLDFTPPRFDMGKIDRDEWSMFRYRAFMALDDDTAWRDITLGEGMTPIVRLDENVLLKMDYFMPTLSFKDRGAAVLIAQMAGFYKSRGMDLSDALFDIYEEYGYMREETRGFTFEGAKGAATMQAIMKKLREERDGY